MKIGIIRCQERSNQCAGRNCFPAIQNKAGEYLTGYDTIELVGYDTCGGCGRNKADKILARALRLKEHGAEVIHLSNCLVDACPFKELYEKELKEKVGVPIVERVHGVHGK
jgi:predicted metal-binding protein